MMTRRPGWQGQDEQGDNGADEDEGKEQAEQEGNDGTVGPHLPCILCEEGVL